MPNYPWDPLEGNHSVVFSILWGVKTGAETQATPTEPK